MNYRIMLHPLAVESLEKLDDPVRSQLIKRLKTLQTQPKKGKRLRMGMFRSLRLGDFRAIYEIWRDHQTVVILLIAKRKNIYEKFDRRF